MHPDNETTSSTGMPAGTLSRRQRPAAIDSKETTASNIGNRTVAMASMSNKPASKESRRQSAVCVKATFSIAIMAALIMSLLMTTASMTMSAQDTRVVPQTNQPLLSSDKKKLIQYALYGNSLRYTPGALSNARMARLLFPGWTVRIYHDNTVPDQVLHVLRAEPNLELLNVSGSMWSNMTGMLWRYMDVSSERDTVERYLVKDIDSALSVRERISVLYWERSGLPFLSQRDHMGHSYAMQGGAVGMTSDAVPNMKELLVQANMTDKVHYQADQKFLQGIIWPTALKLGVVQHDSSWHGQAFQAWGFPTPLLKNYQSQIAIRDKSTTKVLPECRFCPNTDMPSYEEVQNRSLWFHPKKPPGPMGFTRSLWETGNISSEELIADLEHLRQSASAVFEQDRHCPRNVCLVLFQNVMEQINAIEKVVTSCMGDEPSTIWPNCPPVSVRPELIKDSVIGDVPTTSTAISESKLAALTKTKFKSLDVAALIPPKKPVQISQAQRDFDVQYDSWLGPAKGRPFDSGDWWKFNTDDDARPPSIRKKAETNLAQARNDWYKKSILDKNKTVACESRSLDALYCVQYETSKEVLWTPPKEALCNWTNTAIFWHSMHGTMAGRDFRQAKPGQHWMWEFADELNTGVECSCPDTVAFVFADNDDGKKSSHERLVEQSYKKCNQNCHYFHVGKDYQPWDWYGKIGPVRDLLQNAAFQERFDYVVLTDANDQTLTRSPHDIVSRFEFYNADVVIGGEATSYPNWQNQEKNAENARSPWSRHHQPINAGGIMGRTEPFLKYLEMAKVEYETYTRENADSIRENKKNDWRDQTWFRVLHLNHYPKIKVDSLAMLWSRVDVYLNDL